jgi:hypothetical protein
LWRLTDSGLSTNNNFPLGFADSSRSKILAGSIPTAIGSGIASTINPKRKGLQMKLFTDAQFEQMQKNGLPENFDSDQIPVVKLFLPGSACTWILTQIDSEYPTIAFGLCDLGMGCPELGDVSITELESICHRGIFAVERDLHFKAKYPLSVYVRAARDHDYIVESDPVLSKYVKPQR